jgi:hypothetical protein
MASSPQPPADASWVAGSFDVVVRSSVILESSTMGLSSAVGGVDEDETAWKQTASVISFLLVLLGTIMQREGRLT